MDTSPMQPAGLRTRVEQMEPEKESDTVSDAMAEMYKRGTTSVAEMREQCMASVAEMKLQGTSLCGPRRRRES